MPPAHPAGVAARTTEEMLLRRLMVAAPPEAWAELSALQIADRYGAVVAEASVDSDPEAALRALAAALAAMPALGELRARGVPSVETGEPHAAAPVIDTKAALHALGHSLLIEEAEERAQDLLLLQAGDDGERLALLTNRFLNRAVALGLWTTPERWSLAPVERLHRRWAEMDGRSELVGDVIDTLRLNGVLRDVAVAHGAARHVPFDAETAPALVAEVREAAARLPGHDPSRGSTRRFFALLETARDRDAAAALFADLEDPPAEAATYLTTAALDIARPVLAARRDSLFSSLEILNTASDATSGPIWLFSCDVRSLTAHFPYWLSVADACRARGIELHFILCADGPEVDRLLDRAEDLRQALANFRGLDPNRYAGNVGFSVWPVPSWCLNPAAFAECAAFLGAGELGRQLGRSMLIQDLGGLMTRDPAYWSANLDPDRIGARYATGLQWVAPWRRVQHEVLHVPHSPVAADALEAFESYLMTGLLQESSAGLLGNALAWLAERAPGGVWPLPRRMPVERYPTSGLMELEGDPEL